LAKIKPKVIVEDEYVQVDPKLWGKRRDKKQE
jgi:hypothetical protein